MILLKPAAHSHTNKQIFDLCAYNQRDVDGWPAMPGGRDSTLTSQMTHTACSHKDTGFRWLNKCSRSPHQDVRGRHHTHTQSQLTLSRWAAAPSRWCSTRHTWKDIPSPPWHPSCKLCQWLPYLPQTEQCWLFCARQLRRLWGQKAGPGSFVMSKLIATQHKDISSTTGWRNCPPREARNNKCSVLSRSHLKVMLACSCRFPC